jgi:chondroitin AC lyase
VSHDVNGICAFDGNYNGIKARKAYFIFGNTMVCLGAGITAAKSNPIITSVNQCFANGPITASTGKTVATLANAETVYSSADHLKWAYHDHIGYIFPNGGNINIKNSTQTGNWSDIGTLSETATGKVFSLWFDHSKAPDNASYQYIVAPGLTLNEFQSYSANHGFVVVSNTTNIQAVKNRSAGLYGVVFYEAGTIDFGKNFKVTADRAAIVIISKQNLKYNIAVADPMYNAESISLIINRKVEGENVLSGDAKSAIHFKMPSGDLTGSTISDNYKISEFEN